MPRGARTLFGKPLIEVIDLYKWGARVSDICMLYDLSPRTLKRVIRGHGVQMRPPHAPPIAQVKYEQRAESRIKSTRPQIPDDVRVVDGSQAPDQLLRSSAHAQRDRRTARRQSGASTGSCPAKASECRYAFLRSGNRLRDLE